MGKAGWQVAAAIFASLSVMLGALAWNSSRALEIANAELRSSEETLVAVYGIESPDGLYEALVEPERCINGESWMRVGGFYVEPKPGEAMPCKHVRASRVRRAK